MYKISVENGSLTAHTDTALGSKGYPKEKMNLLVDGQLLTMVDNKSVEVFDSKVKGIKANVMDKGLDKELRLFALAIQGKNPWPNPLWQQAQAMEIAFAVEQTLKEG